MNNSSEQMIEKIWKLSKEEFELKRLYYTEKRFNFQKIKKTEEVKQLMYIISNLCPQISKQIQQTTLSEESWFSEGATVSIIKHLRYLPAFAHRHHFFEIVYVLEGNCMTTMGGREIFMESGDVCIISPGTGHSIGVFEENSIIINCLVRASTFEKTFLGILSENKFLSDFFEMALYGLQNDSYLMFRTGNDYDVRRFLLYAYDESFESRRYKNTMLNSIVTSFFAILLSNHEQNVFLMNSGRHKKDTNVVEILQYIQDNFSTVTLGDVSKKFNYSERQMMRIIQKYAGMNFSQLLVRIKMEKAVNYLKKINLTMGVISELLGYGETSNFLHAFKKYYNVSAGEYRKQYNTEQ